MNIAYALTVINSATAMLIVSIERALHATVNPPVKDIHAFAFS